MSHTIARLDHRVYMPRISSACSGAGDAWHGSLPSTFLTLWWFFQMNCHEMITADSFWLSPRRAGRTIIAITRSTFKYKLGELATDLETQRTLAFQRADELTLLNSIATVGVEADQCGCIDRKRHLVN